MKRKKILLLFVTLFSLAGIYWINSGMTGLRTASDLAYEEETINYTLPPGYIFSIWGLIYLGFLAYAIAGLSRKGMADPHMNRTSLLYSISIFMNALWTLVVGLDLWTWAYFLQWAMLIVAIILMFQWELYKKPLSHFQRIFSIPFALYAGWLTVAMIPFTSDLLNRSGWDFEPFSQVTWAVIVYAIAFIIVLAAFLKLKQPFYLLPLAWAFFGFVMKFEGLLGFVAGGLGVVLVGIFIFRVEKFLNSTRALSFQALPPILPSIIFVLYLKSNPHGSPPPLPYATQEMETLFLGIPDALSRCLLRVPGGE